VEGGGEGVEKGESGGVSGRANGLCGKGGGVFDEAPGLCGERGKEGSCGVVWRREEEG